MPWSISDRWRLRVAERAGKRVMIVDDAALVRLYYRDALERGGFRVEEAMNGIEALEKLSGESFDLLILDVNMPKMDGITFLRRLRRRNGPEAGIPVLVTSTEGGPQDKAAARAAGANFYLVKPLAQDAVVSCVAMLCGVSPDG
jgi:two-component system, chemotaxis family, chemotaxis protein CheY